MDNHNYNTETKKGQHLTFEEREEIQIRLKDNWSIYKISKTLSRAYNTIKTEITRGTVELYNGHIRRYKATSGQAKYEKNRQASRRQYKRLKASRFIKWTEEQYKSNKWSFDVCVGRALESNRFSRDDMVCTKTLYNYADKGLIGIKNIDLPEKLRRNTKSKVVRQNKRNLGKSIEERPESISERKEFGHWEFDSVLGNKKADEPVVLTLIERMTRNAIWLKVKDHSAAAVSEAVSGLKAEYGDLFSKVFKTITADNGSEFSELATVKPDDTEVYFTHPFSSWEKGTNECHNRILRRFIPKGEPIANYSDDDISFMADWANSLPRKILSYKTPGEIFDEQLDLIYTAD